MAYVNTTNTTVSLDGIGAYLGDRVATLRAAWAQYRKEQKAIAELQLYSDRELSDLGFARSEIARVVRSASAKKG